jgi:hypothetical protein
MGARLAFGLAMAALALALAAPGFWRPVEDPDIWWLLWAGENPDLAVNGFSWTAPHHPWVLHEPLVARVYAMVGPNGIGPIRGLLHAVLVGSLLMVAWRKRRGWSSVVGLVWLMPLLSLGLSERAMAWGLAAAALQALCHHHGRHGLAALCVGLWSWVHGSFPLGVAVALVTSPRHGLLALALTIPRFEAWLLAFQYLGGGGTMELLKGHIQEWGWLVPDSLPQALRLAAVGSAIVVARKRPLLLLLLVPLAVRHWRMCAPLGVFLLAPMVDGLRLPRRDCANPLPWMLAGLLPAAALSEARLVEPDIHPVRGALYNDLTLGGWLGYRGYAPFWDARNDCYPEDVYADGLRIAYRHDLAVLDAWQIRQVLTRDAELAQNLQDRGFRIQEESGQLWLLIRKLE